MIKVRTYVSWLLIGFLLVFVAYYAAGVELLGLKVHESLLFALMGAGLIISVFGLLFMIRYRTDRNLARNRVKVYG